MKDNSFSSLLSSRNEQAAIELRQTALADGAAFKVCLLMSEWCRSQAGIGCD